MTTPDHAPPLPPLFTVSQITRALKDLIEPTFRSVQIQGEVTNLRLQASGHAYFSLKDRNSQISAVLFKGTLAKLRSRPPRDGEEVIVQGEIALYLPRGTYQVIVREICYQGLGDLLLELHRRKQDLQARGWFDPTHKRSLPTYPKCIGVVTSPTGSVIQDILNVLERRSGSRFQLLLNPVRVQGEGAAQEIAQAIETFNRFKLADVLIVGRGGGSLEDLWPFNEEVVSRAIFESTLPIISAIGHETDQSLADYVADLRAPTPSAAAEICSETLASQLEFLDQTKRTLDLHLQHHLKGKRSLLLTLVRHPLFADPQTFFSLKGQQIDELRDRLQRETANYLRRDHTKLAYFSKRLDDLNPQRGFSKLRKAIVQLRQQQEHRLKEQLSKKREMLSRLSAHLNAIHPQNILQKGYCIPFHKKTNSVIMSAEAVTQGELLSVVFHDGEVGARVETIDLNKVKSREDGTTCRHDPTVT